MAENTGDCRSVCIKEWKAAYYVTRDKKWRYGRMVLIPEGVGFTDGATADFSTDRSDCTAVTVPFSSFIDIKKTTSGLIFAVITISTKTDRHWFGSLTDRESVFNALMHFWKTRLIPEHKGRPLTGGGKTKLGKELLKLAYDSQDTFSSAAKTLHHQGQQIDYSLSTMDDLHNDLDVADKLVTGLESWLGNWSSSAQIPLVDPEVIRQTDLPDISNFEVLYAKATGASESPFTQGSLWISRKEGVTILGAKQEIVQHFGPGGITLSRIRVINPWELTLTSYRVGEPDINYRVFSTKAVEALKQLENSIRNKVEYMRPCPVYITVSPSIKAEGSDLLTTTKLSPLSKSESGTSQSGSTLKVQGQLLQKSAPVSDQEVQELSEILSNLKTMAVAVQQEEDQQLENLDSLLTSVDRANVRRADLEDRVQKLIRK